MGPHVLLAAISLLRVFTSRHGVTDLVTAHALLFADESI
jgi:hypothetical protein